jgi:hypothetical protein
MMVRILLLLACLFCCSELAAAPVDSPALASAWQSLLNKTPTTGEGFVAADAKGIAAAALALEARAAEHFAKAKRAAETVTREPSPESDHARPRLRERLRRAREQMQAQAETRRSAAKQPTSVVAALEPLLLAKHRIDRLTDKLFLLRSAFTPIKPDEQQRAALRNYLRTMSALIDLSGRLRYIHFDAINEATGTVVANPAERDRLIALLTQYQSTIGASVLIDLLFEPAADEPDAAALRANDATKSNVLSLVAAARQTDVLSDLADYVLGEAAPAPLLIQAAETIRLLGLPQDPLPNQDSTLPTVALTAVELREALGGLGAGKLSPALEKRHAELIAWLDQRIEKGATDETYETGYGSFAPGDWLLMRNPSPYNLFTDISPGLFTHVGVVTSMTPDDGVRRIVLVDLPERGTRMPATTIDTFVKRTRHFVVLRHKDQKVAQAMADAAAAMIGNETQFDLNFRTKRINEYAGKPLKDAKIHTYCAGLLLLCALQSGQPREEFFPIGEYPAPGKTQANLISFGMSIGEDFISPTGALFSDKFGIVAQREPMYDPRREVEEAIYNHFAEKMVTTDIHPTADAFQALRLTVAEASKSNPLLATALASAANVNADMDLVAAAKAAAVVEALDEIAKQSSADFLAAQEAMRAGDARQLQKSGLKPDQIAQIEAIRRRHAELLSRWNAARISPRELRIALANDAIARGKRGIDERFFAP